MYTTISLREAIALLGEQYEPHLLGYMLSAGGQVFDLQLFPELKTAEIFSTDPIDLSRLKRLAQRSRVKVIAAFC